MQSKTRQPGRDRNATGVVDGSDQGAPDVIRHRRISLRPECRVVAREPVSLTAEPDVGDAVFCAEVWRITSQGPAPEPRTTPEPSSEVVEAWAALLLPQAARQTASANALAW